MGNFQSEAGAAGAADTGRGADADRGHLARAVELAARNAAAGGRPFGAVLLAPDGSTVEGVNETNATGDPSAHAELQAIRAASRTLGARLDGCVMYASGQPCPMCLAAMHLTGFARVVYAYSNADGEPFGLSTAEVYAQMAKPLSEQAIPVEYLPVRLDGDDPLETWKRRGSP